MIKIISCEGCEAVFKIQHDLEERFYPIAHCPFCGDSLNIDNEDDIEDFDEDE